MDASVFFASAPLREALDRAQAIWKIPIAIHHVTSPGDRTTPEEKLAGAGGCEVCAFVKKRPWGGAMCRTSRARSHGVARRRKSPVPFLCHMGFPCVSIRVTPGAKELYMLTLGPFSPTEAPDSLEEDAREGEPGHE